jgi:hypothetical protein
MNRIFLLNGPRAAALDGQLLICLEQAAKTLFLRFAPEGCNVENIFGLLGEAIDPCSDQLFIDIERIMGTDAVFGFGAKALKSLHEQLAIGLSELGAGQFGSDRAAQNLVWRRLFH